MYTNSVCKEHMLGFNRRVAAMHFLRIHTSVFSCQVVNGSTKTHANSRNEKGLTYLSGQTNTTDEATRMSCFSLILLSSDRFINPLYRTPGWLRCTYRRLNNKASNSVLNRPGKCGRFCWLVIDLKTNPLTSSEKNKYPSNVSYGCLNNRLLLYAQGSGASVLRGKWR